MRTQRLPFSLEKNEGFSLETALTLSQVSTLTRVPIRYARRRHFLKAKGAVLGNCNEKYAKRFFDTVFSDILPAGKYRFFQKKQGSSESEWKVKRKGSTKWKDLQGEPRSIAIEIAGRSIHQKLKNERIHGRMHFAILPCDESPTDEGAYCIDWDGKGILLGVSSY